MRLISQGRIEFLFRDTLNHSVFVGMPVQMRSYVTLSHLLNLFMGEVWAKRLEEALYSTKDATPYGQRFNLVFVRLASFASALYEMQSWEGFDSWLLLARKSDKPIDVMAEAIMAHLVWGAGYEVRFVDPTGKGIRKSYDIEIFRGEEIVYGEIKSRRDDTDVTVKSMLNLLKGACGQLPKDSPAILLLWLGDVWFKHPSLDQIIGEALHVGLPDKGIRAFFEEKPKLLGVVARGWGGDAVGADLSLMYTLSLKYANESALTGSPLALEVLTSLQDATMNVRQPTIDFVRMGQPLRAASVPHSAHVLPLAHRIFSKSIERSDSASLPSAQRAPSERHVARFFEGTITSWFGPSERAPGWIRGAIRSRPSGMTSRAACGRSDSGSA